MYSSTNYLNSFPQLHSPFVGTGAAAGYFPVHHPLLGYLVPPDAPVFHDQALINNMTVSEKKPQDDIVKLAKKPSRKDRHSKICTSQGLRDRRVRLSIGVSRQFFHLQDMLGFDKASKTLEWLLDKSKNDINELSKSVLSSNSDSEITDVLADDQDGDPAASASASKDYKKMKKLAKKDAFARECRAKARERARERTREKLCTFNTTTTLMVKEPTKGPESGQHIVQQSHIVINKLMMPPFERSSKGLEDWDISSDTTRSSQCYMNLSTELQMYGKP